MYQLVINLKKTRRITMHQLEANSIFTKFKDPNFDWDDTCSNTRLYQNQEAYNADRRTQRMIKEDFINCHGTVTEYFSTAFGATDFFQEDGEIKIDRCFDVMVYYPNLAKITRDYLNFGFYDNKDLVGNISFRHFRRKCRDIKSPQLKQHRVSDGFDCMDLNIDFDKIEPMVGDFLRLKIGDGRYIYKVSRVWAPIDNLQGLSEWEITLIPYTQDMNTVFKDPDTGEYGDINLGGIGGDGQPLSPDANDPSQGPGNGQGGVDVIIDGSDTPITIDGQLVYPGIRLLKDKNPKQINSRKRLKPTPLQNAGGLDRSGDTMAEDGKPNFAPQRDGWWTEDSAIRQDGTLAPQLQQIQPKPITTQQTSGSDWMG